MKYDSNNQVPDQLNITHAANGGDSKIIRAVLMVVVATGISSVVLQLISIRELLSRFQGNEFVIAIILFSWLALGGVGTFLAYFLTRRYFKATVSRLVWISHAIGCLPILQLLAIRELYDLVFVPGSSVGFYPTLLYVVATLAPYGLLLGFVLPYSLYVLQSLTPDYPGARIYITDNIGDIAGGALFSFVLVYLVSPFTAVCLSILPLLIALWLLMARSGGFKIRYLWGGIVALAILSSGLLLENATLMRPGSKLIHYQESRYGRIEVHQNQEMRTLFIDGVPLFTNQNQTIAEEIVHYPLAQLDLPRHILIISGEGGIMQEVEKYNLETVDYVELDPEVTAAEIRYGLIKKIEGLNIIHRDGRRFLAGTSKQYDAVIMNLPEPETYQLNRFYTDQFYHLVKNRLKPHGVLSFAMQGFDNYLPEPQRQKLALTFHTLKRHFKYVMLLPGQQTFYICGNKPLTTDIPERLEELGIPTRYISGYYAGNLTAWRISNLNNLMEPATAPNLDFSPRLMRLMFSQWFTKYSTSPHLFAAIVLLLSAGYLMLISKESFVLFTTGFVNMGSEILIIFAFQIIFGYIYFQIGIIVTVFLTGLLPGAWLSDRLQYQGRQWLLAVDGALILLSGLFILGITIGGYRLPVGFFLAYGFLVSLVSGFQFPVALKMQGGRGSAVAQAFSADLMGAACGTVVTSLLLIPHLGIVWTTAALMGLKLSSVILWQRGFFSNQLI